MTTLALKSYQQAALDALTVFARAAQLKGAALAFGEQVGRAYNPDAYATRLACACAFQRAGAGC